MNKPSGTPSKVKKRRKKPSELNNLKKLLFKNEKGCENMGSGLSEEAQLRDRECCLTNPNFAIICSFLQQEKDSHCLFDLFVRIVYLFFFYIFKLSWKSVFRIRIELNTDPDPAFKVNTDPDPDPGF